MRAWLALAMLVCKSAAAVPGAAPVELCDYSEPEYSGREVAAVRAYGQCVSNAALAQSGNVIAQRCNDLVNAASGRSGADERTIECGSGPAHKHCRVAVAVGWCTYASDARKDLPDLYACDDLVRRYPDLRPVVEACAPLAAARQEDARNAEAMRGKCARANAEGYAVTSAKCRKPRTVVPPGMPRPQ
jgi:hypothetical protein